MATTLIIAETAPVCAGDPQAFITRETEQLCAHLFAHTRGLDWTGAWNRAIAELPDLLAYAAEWDASAAPEAAARPLYDMDGSYFCDEPSAADEASYRAYQERLTALGLTDAEADHATA